MENGLGHCMLTRRIHCNKVCGVLIDNYMVEFEYRSVVMDMSVILHSLMPCSHYLLQNFWITVVLFFVTIFGAPLSCVKYHYSVMSQGTWHCCHISILFSSAVKFVEHLFRISCAYSAKMMPFWKFQLNCIIQTKKLDSLNEKNSSAFELCNYVHSPL
jgi:hypothetical protein